MVNKREGKRLNPIQVGLRADMAALEALVGRALKWVGGRQIPRAIGQRSSEHNRGPMKASVRTFHSPDVDLVTHRPGDPGDVGVLIQILAGPSGGPGEESFDVLACTPRWLDRRLRDVGPIVGRHHLIVEEFDAPRIQEFLRVKVESLDAPTWSKLATKIGRIGRWEFEDYRP